MGEVESLWVAGRGALGRSLARALNAPLLSGRELASQAPPAPAAVVFLAVPDAALGPLAQSLAAAGWPEQVSFVHLAGALGLGELARLSEEGHAVGSFHPLQTFPGERAPSAFQGITIAVDASNQALLSCLEQLAARLGASPRRVAGEKRGLYHAAAVLASGGLASLLEAALRVLGEAGWSRQDSLSALLPLAEGTLQEVRRRGLPEALSGPFRRGDEVTVRSNLLALQEPSLNLPQEIYVALGLVAIELGEAIGLDPDRVRRLRAALEEAVP